MASILGNAGSAVGDGIAGVGKGVGEAGKGVGNGVGEGVGAIGRGVTGATGQPDHPSTQEENSSPGGSQPNFLAGVGKSGVDFVGKGFSNGFQLAGNISKETLDLQRNVASGIGGMGGTAIDAVVGAASAGTGAVFDPIANGLKSIEGLEALGEGVDQINGLSTNALQGVASITKEALAVAGRPPTFFDPDHDGIVKFEDTKKGFTILGLEEQYAKMAAYALHTTFSFSTSETWDPRSSALAPDMPIRIEKMPQTRWGKNWGNYERIDWVSDADVETFFGMRERQTYAEYFRDR
ncbi:hypothetical protein CYLTODRAFT_428152 [Cylindrobasidium torrendii FP15055 ss-10]|uniref:Uncharacterized protein n=1 Tax=Cylindrobasidium torrendii FP15055 ss-10 TaxID=1314674 RepID=A0A0D7BUG6_9AGAR|nr:hypothetical protein CYLTODRAFT_428152 [Cylindrobasidium torrendii FP15055 ss-10]